MQSTATRRSTASILRTLAVGAIGAGLLSLVSCSAARFPAWRYPQFDVNRTDVFPAAWQATWRPRRLSSVKLPGALGSHPTLLFGDMLGGAAPEVVLFGNNLLLIYSDAGRLIRRVRLTGYRRVAGFLYDEDHDGKLDLVFGSSNAARPTLSVVDGTGRVIYAHEIRGASQDYRHFIPWLSLDGQFYFVTQESWPASPRGIIRFSPPEDREVWNFSLPSEPVGLLERVGRHGTVSFLISQLATNQGVYPFIGKTATPVNGFDAALHFLRIDVHGNLLTDRSLKSAGRPLTGEGRFYSLSAAPRSPLLLRQDYNPSSQLESPSRIPVSEGNTALFVLNPSTGAIASSRRFGSTRVLGLRVLPGRTPAAARIVVLVRTGPRLQLQLYNRALTLLQSRTVASASAELGTVLAPSSGAPPKFFLLAGDRLLLYDEELNAAPILKEAAATQMLISIAPDGKSGRLILVGRRLQVYALG